MLDRRPDAGNGLESAGLSATMTHQHLTLERDGHVATITLSRPESLNALNGRLVAELERVATELHDDEETRVVVVTGAGKHFSAGVDLKDPERAERDRDSRLMRWRYLRAGPRLVRSFLELQQITIAAVNGAALGGAACLISVCDFRLGAEDATVGYPEINLGMNLSWMGVPPLVHLVGPARAKRMLLLGHRESAQTLGAWGFFDEVVPGDLLLGRAKELAAELASKPPMAAQMIKRGVNAAATALDHAVMHMDTDQFMLATETDDHREAIEAFLQRRKAVFRGT